MTEARDERRNGDMTEKTVRLGIIGFGAQGSMYARLLADGMVPNMTIGAISDVDPQRARAAAEQCPGVPFYDTVEALLDCGDVDAVVATVPHYLHPEVGIAALSRGIHALIEKPAGVYTKQVEELNAFAASRPELTFGIMFNQRSNPLYRRLKEIVDAGEIGAIRRSELDHHDLVAPAGLLRPERVARDLGRRGRRRPRQPGAASARPLAVDLRCPRARCSPRSRTVSGATSPWRTR